MIADLAKPGLIYLTKPTVLHWGVALREIGAALSAYYVQQTERKRCAGIAEHVSWATRHDSREKIANEIWDAIITPRFPFI